MTYFVFGGTLNLTQLQLQLSVHGSVNYQCDIKQSKNSLIFLRPLKFSQICRYLEVMNCT